MTLTPSLSDEIIAYKGSDEAVTVSTTLQDDDDLKFPMAANEVWEFQFFVLFTTSASPDFKMTISGPGTPDSLRAHVSIWNATGSDTDIGDIITAYDTEVAQTIGSSGDTAGYISGVVENGSTAGDLVLRWAQRVSNANATTVKRGSYVVARKLLQNSFTGQFEGSISGGINHAAVLDRNGQAWTWGRGTAGQLGEGIVTNRSSPVAVVGEHVFSRGIFAAYEHSVGLKSDGSAWGWGLNDGIWGGAVGDNTGARRSSPVSVVGGHFFSSIGAGGQASHGLKPDGTPWTWGRNDGGYLGDGTVISRSSPVSVIGEHLFVKLSQGRLHAAALKSDGTAWSWGSGTNGRLGNNSTPNRSSPVSVVGNNIFDQVSAGGTHSIGLKSEGTAWAWGLNSNGQLGINLVTTRSSPVSVVGNHVFIAIDAGYVHCLGLKADGTAWTWGSNNQGQLGDGTIISRSSPVSVIGDHVFVNLHGSDNNPGSSYALKDDGSAWAWGDGGFGCLADGSSPSWTDRSSPVSVIG